MATTESHRNYDGFCCVCRMQHLRGVINGRERSNACQARPNWRYHIALLQVVKKKSLSREDLRIAPSFFILKRRLWSSIPRRGWQPPFGQVFWLPVLPTARAFPSRYQRDSGLLQVSSPVTAAGPCRSFTGFPIIPSLGTRICYLRYGRLFWLSRAKVYELQVR